MTFEALFLVPLAAASATAATASAGLADELIAGAAFLAIITGAAGAVYTTKKRAELEAARGSAASWKEERDAEISRAARLAEQLRVEADARRAAESRTDVTAVMAQMTENHAATLAILNRMASTLEVMANGNGVGP